ncbi:MAG: ABC transporter substrate-binding protein [Candidatus Rokuibacteriota bacterium]
MLMTRRVLALLLTAFLIEPLGTSRDARADGATDYIRARIERIYDLLGSSGTAAAPDRQAAARKTLDEMFDWTEMGKRSLGQYWQERTPVERTEFVELFASLFQRTYLSRIELADREKFQYLGETVDGDSAIVKTVVVTQKGRQIPVDYIARRAGGEWRVHDLGVDGTSLIDNYRAQFTTLIARSSYRDLIQKLRDLVGKSPGTSRAPGLVLVGAGDIASCTSDGDEATASLLDAIGGVVFTLGDHAYDSGTSIEFAACYEPSWGRHKSRTRPAPGNHDYATSAGSGYFAYFGARAGDPAKGYYSYDLGSWHIIVLNSNCPDVGGCGPGSAQERWLRADLAAHPSICTLAYWHHPRFSSGPHGSEAALAGFWQALYEQDADVALAGHVHNYERFAPQKPNGEPDPVGGLRQFIVGTGGASHHRFEGPPIANSEVRNDDTFGVLKLTLRATSYEWRFLPVAGAAFTDSGIGRCR